MKRKITMPDLGERYHVMMRNKQSNNDQRKLWKKLNYSERHEIDNYESAKLIKIWKFLTEGMDFKGKTVLDYGCSNGVWTRKYLEAGAKVTGIDYIWPKKYVGKDFVLADIAYYVHPKQVDIVHTAQVMMHLEPSKQDEALKAIYNNVKPGGYVIMIENSKDTSVRTWGRDWKEALYFYGFNSYFEYGDGIVQGVIGMKEKT